MDAEARPGSHPPCMSLAYPFLRGVEWCACARGRTCFCERCRQPQGFRWLLRCNISRTRFCVVGLARLCGYVGGMRAGEPLPSAESNSKKIFGRTRFCVPEGSWKDPSAAGRTCFCVPAAQRKQACQDRPYPFLRGSRAVPDLVRCSRAYPILRGAQGWMVSGKVRRARPGVPAGGGMGMRGAGAERLAVCMTGAGGERRGAGM